MARTGRPRGFDRKEALATAMRLFWRHGYEGTSLDLLRGAMGASGLSSASFYAAFRSKEALYREAVGLYLSTHGQVTAALRDPELPPRARVERALRDSAAMQTDASHPPGCLVALSATIGSDNLPPIQAITAEERRSNRSALLACIQEAVARGSLREDTEGPGLAALFEGLLLGLSIQARDGLEHGVLDAAVTQALRAWDANRADAPREA